MPTSPWPSRNLDHLSRGAVPIEMGRVRSSTKKVLKNKRLGEACNRVEREEWPANSGGCLQATGMAGSLNVNKEVLGPVGVAASVKALVSKAVVSTLEVRAEGGF